MDFCHQLENGASHVLVVEKNNRSRTALLCYLRIFGAKLRQRQAGFHIDSSKWLDEWSLRAAGFSAAEALSMPAQQARGLLLTGANARLLTVSTRING